MTETIAGITIPDTVVVKAATELVLDVDDDLLFHHSRRVYLWGMLKSLRRGHSPDPELTYVGAMFHDLGLTPKYRIRHQRFEVDDTEIARQFLLDHGYSAAEAGMAWLSIALPPLPASPNTSHPRSTSLPSESRRTCSARTSMRLPTSNAQQSPPRTRAQTSRIAYNERSTTA